jgi:mRNA interferase MazF
MPAEALERGDLWLVDFGSNPERAEQAVQRPAVIVSDDRLHHPRLHVVILVPGTTTIRRLPLHVIVEPEPSNGLTARTAFQVEQVRSLSTARLVSRLGSLDAASQRSVDDVLRDVLHLATD